METAYHYGSWKNIANIPKIAVPERGQTESWFQFTLALNEQIYIRCSSDEEFTNMIVETRDIANVLSHKENPDDLIRQNPGTPSLCVDCDNLTDSTRTYYLRVIRGDYDITKDMYLSLDAGNRIRTRSVTFSFSGQATNPGNTSMSLSGMDSSELRLDLLNSAKIPQDAIVTALSTSGSLSPNQSNIHHLVMPETTGTWFEATTSSASGGSIDISSNPSILARQIWRFKYNALASGRSTMSNVKLMMTYQYDMANTQYEIFVN